MVAGCGLSTKPGLSRRRLSWKPFSAYGASSVPQARSVLVTRDGAKGTAEVDGPASLQPLSPALVPDAGPLFDPIAIVGLMEVSLQFDSDPFSAKVPDAFESALVSTLLCGRVTVCEDREVTANAGTSLKWLVRLDQPTSFLGLDGAPPQINRIETPPSASIALPVTNDAASESKKAAASAISSGSAIRPSA